MVSFSIRRRGWTEHLVCYNALVDVLYTDMLPGFTQCPIAPGKSFTYRTEAELFGTSWWHAHFSAQYADGTFGPIVVYGPYENDYDIDIGPILLNDYHHMDWVSIVKNITTPKGQGPPPAPVADTNLISGKMQCDCSGTPAGRKCSKNAGLSSFRFQSGKKHRLRLINAGTDSSQQFSIDGHTMTVIENDYVAVQPYDTKIVTLGTGQRTDVIVKAIGKPKDTYWMRSTMTCVQNPPPQPEALAMVYYESADTKSVPSSSAWPNPSPGCASDPLEQTIPAFPIALPNPDKTVTMNINVAPDATGVWKWTLNGVSTRVNLSSPVLSLATAGTPSSSFPKEWSVYDMGQAKSYRFIMNNPGRGTHPLHLHGHNMYILDVGSGQWQGKIVRPENPVRRDTVTIPAGGYVVWQADADNPGAWAFHCHTLWHAATGFGIDILERPDVLKGAPIPPELGQLCKDWKLFEQKTNYQHIDSGL
jgi:FtsP/CotA-like multicopper oxidase with cupredoxin domain